MSRTILPKVKWKPVCELVKGVDYETIDGLFIDLRPNELLDVAMQCGSVFIDEALSYSADEAKSLWTSLDAISKAIDNAA
jgi:hypothetical protein